MLYRCSINLRQLFYYITNTETKTHKNHWLQIFSNLNTYTSNELKHYQKQMNVRQELHSSVVSDHVPSHCKLQKVTQTLSSTNTAGSI